MAHTPTPPEPGPDGAPDLATLVIERHGLPRARAVNLALQYLTRERDHGLREGWWLELLDAQFQTHIGPHPRVRCGEERHLAHLTPEPGRLCHDCGCARGEYHVFGCDAEECSVCGGQAFCCDCPDDPCYAPPASPHPHADAA